MGSLGGYEGRFSTDLLPVFSAGGPCEQFLHGQSSRVPLKCVLLLFCLQSVRDVLLVGHRQAFAWIDDWYGKCKQNCTV